jgi:tyrosine-protein kinase Etk/Wzc
MSEIVPFKSQLPANDVYLPPNQNPGGSYVPAGIPDDEISLGDVIAVLRRHIWLVLGIAVLVTAVAGVVLARQHPQYQSQALIRLKDQRGAMTGGIDNDVMDQVLGKAADPVLSQLQVLQSRTVATQVVRRTNVRLQPMGKATGLTVSNVSIRPDAPADTLNVAFGDSTFTASGHNGSSKARYGDPAIVDGISFTFKARPNRDDAQIAVLSELDAIKLVRERMKSGVRDKTDAIELSFTAYNPIEAQELTDAAVSTFQELNAETARNESHRRRIFIEEQLHGADSVLLVAQNELGNFRETHQAFSTREKAEAQQTTLMGLDVRREELGAERRMYDSLLTRLSNSRGTNELNALQTLVSMPEVATNAVVAQLYGQLVQYQTVRDTMVASGRAANGPDVARMNALIASTQDKLAGAVKSHVAAVDTRLEALDQLKSRSVAALESLPSSESEETRLVQRLATVQQLTDDLRGEYQKAQIAEAVEVGQVEVVDKADLPVLPIGSGRGLKLLLALMLGLMLGSGAAFVSEHLNTSVRSKDDVEQMLRAPGLVVIPRIAPAVKAHGRLAAIFSSERALAPAPHTAANAAASLITVSDVRSAGAEAFRTLRTNLIFSSAINRLRRLVVTSAAAGEGKTTVSSNLAVTMAQQGMRVLLVDCDLRRPRAHNQFGLPREPGLTQVALGFVAPEDAIRQTSVERLSVLTAGALPPNPSELLGGTRIQELFDQLAEQYDLLIIDSPPLLAASDAAILGKNSDGVVVVVRAGITGRTMLERAGDQLAAVGARVVGAVLNDPDAKLPTYDPYYAYQYTYGSYSEEPTSKTAV